MKILFFGDIFGKPGREAVKKILPEWQKEFKPDVLAANVENLAHGDSVTRETLEELAPFKFDFYTTGNHIANRKEGRGLLEDPSIPLLRPANMGEHFPGKLWLTKNIKGQDVTFLNLIGQIQFKPTNYDNPFRLAEKIIPQIEAESPSSAIIVDFHAEATSEKQALARFLDGKVSAVIGTHTHVPTADAKILPSGTAYITDVGMTGPANSIIGLDPKNIVSKYVGSISGPVDIASGEVEVNAVLIEIEGKKAVSIRHLQKMA